MIPCGHQLGTCRSGSVATAATCGTRAPRTSMGGSARKRTNSQLRTTNRWLGRRLRIAATDALGYDARTSDPLYKHMPIFIVRTPSESAPGGFIAYGILYDSQALGSSPVLEVRPDLLRRRGADLERSQAKVLVHPDHVDANVQGPLLDEVERRVRRLGVVQPDGGAGLGGEVVRDDVADVGVEGRLGGLDPVVGDCGHARREEGWIRTPP